MEHIDPDFIEPLTATDIQLHARPNGKKHKRALTLVFLTIFLDVLGFGILIPSIPYLLQQFDKSALTVGLLMMSFSIAQFFAAPVLGAMSDRWGRRPVLLFSIFGGAVAYFAFGFATALWVFFAARIVDGLSGGNISTAQAYITDITPPKERAQKFGLIGAVFGLGFIIGPALGGLLSYISLQAPAFAGAILSLLAVIFGYFMLPETLTPDMRKKEKLTLAAFNPFAQLWRFISVREIMLIFTARFMLMFAMTVMRSNFLVYARDRLNFGPHQVGYLYAFLGILIVGVQGGAVKPLAKRLGEKKMTFLGFASMIVGFACLGTAPGLLLVGVSMVFIGFGHGLAFPSLTSLASTSIDDSQQGAILGAQSSVNSIAMMIGPFVAGWSFDHISMGAPYLFAVVALVIGLAIAWSWNAPAKQSWKSGGISSI